MKQEDIEAYRYSELLIVLNNKDLWDKDFLELERVIRSLPQNELDVISENHNKLIHLSAYQGNIEAVKYLIEKGIDPNSQDYYYSTPLHDAAIRGHLPVVRYLVENGANVNAIEFFNFTPLHGAALKGHLEVLKYLIENGANINAIASNNTSVVSLAAGRGHLEIVKYIKENGADINVKDVHDRTSLHEAALGGHFEVVKYLVENGINIHQEEAKTHKTALYNASINGHLKIVKYLVKNGANINTADNYGKTPLHNAVLRKNFPLIKYLVENGANINAKCKSQSTPLHEGGDRGNLEILMYLIKMDAKVNENKYNHTVLHYAAYKGHLEIVKHLVENHTSLNIKREHLNTSLHTAATNGYLEVVEYLIEKGANINALDQYGHTVLYIAALYGDLKIVQYLLNNNANISIGELPIVEAMKKGHKHITDLLWQKTSDRDKRNLINHHLTRDDYYKIDSLKERGEFDILNIICEQANIEKDDYTALQGEICNNYQVNISDFLKKMRQLNVPCIKAREIILQFNKTAKLNLQKRSNKVESYDFVNGIKNSRNFAIPFTSASPEFNLIDNLPTELQYQIFSYLNADASEALLYRDNIRERKNNKTLVPLKDTDINPSPSKMNINRKTKSYFSLTNLLKVGFTWTRRICIGKLLNKGLKALAPSLIIFDNNA
ncbi:MAG: ankyrin repeat domain-containing protein, partial [Alphaproteobacteria bacterium]|nr:ankyrin repeat domain-containing protein [Alphaproteobacteria bacterium]